MGQRPEQVRLLLIEDSVDDAELLLLALAHAGLDVISERVDSPHDLLRALDRGGWNAILCDHSLPGFTSEEAFELFKRRELDIPFLIVSGTVPESAAVTAMHAGVQDYLSKGQLARLAPALRRELREAAHRSERRQMQEQLLLAERMASIGTLTAGVAHEINNPLAALIVNLRFATDELASLGLASQQQLAGAPAAVASWLQEQLRQLSEPLNDARDSAERLRLITRDLKTFSRGDEELRIPVDVNRVLESTLRMTRGEIHRRARLVEEYGEVPPVAASESRLGQVFLNLVINAVQAIPEGNAGEHQIRLATSLAADGRVQIDVADDGVGIPPGLLGRIFEPFVTTKPVGVGTGLGLPICQRIVTGFAGQILVHSEPGRGTTFTVLLPPADSRSPEQAPPRRTVPHQM